LLQAEQKVEGDQKGRVLDEIQDGVDGIGGRRTLQAMRTTSSFVHA
jgi:hypothetical protein